MLLQDLVEPCRTRTAEEFGAKYAEPVLLILRVELEGVGVREGLPTPLPSRPLVPPPRGVRDDIDTAPATKTGVAEQLRRIAASTLVLPIGKHKVNLYQDKITLGRAPNNDVVLPHPTVSKFHGYFRAEGAAMTFTDYASQNGTRLGWELLAPRVAHPLRDAAQLHFGDVPARYHTPAGLYDYLRGFIVGGEAGKSSA
ncbi:MAG TPA: FHA domain-containing protein [Myxococcota bacterium]|jgi:hypothetical protein|nr:FHA domain-containing protein [Myxococcota bacterium]